MRIRTFLFVGLVLSSWALPSWGGDPSTSIGFSSDTVLRVFVDGKPVGRTPIKAVSVAPGRHAIRYENEKEKSSFEFEVIVSADKPLFCVFDAPTGVNRCSTERETPAAP